MKHIFLKKDHLFSLLLYLCLSIGIILAFYIHSTTTGYSLSMNENVFNPINDDWYYKWEPDGDLLPVMLPSHLKSPNSATSLSITRLLPSNIKPNTYLFFRTSQQIVQVFINGKLIYGYGLDTSRTFGKFPGSAWHFVPFDPSYSGKQITLTLSSPYKNYKGILNEMIIGAKTSCLFYLLKNKALSLFITFAIFIMGLFLIIFSFFYRISYYSNKSSLYLGIFTLLCSIWCFSETQMMQFIITNRLLEYYLDFTCCILQLIPLLLYIKHEYHPKNENLYNLLVIATSIDFIVVILLQVCNIADLIETIFSYHIIIIMTLIVVTLTLIENIKLHQKKITPFIKGILIIGSCASIDLLRSHLPKVSDSALFSRLGMFIVLIMLFIECIKNIQISHIQELKTATLKQLAYFDYMTGLRNRTAFEMHLNHLNDNLGINTCLAIVVCDLNNLKLVNDTLGHQKGDELITLASNILNELFPEVDTIYRIGGDEFVITLQNVSEDALVSCFKKLNIRCKEYSQKWNLPLSVAYGYAFYNPFTHGNLEQVFTEADQCMYACKDEFKKNLL